MHACNKLLYDSVLEASHHFYMSCGEQGLLVELIIISQLPRYLIFTDEERKSLVMAMSSANAAEVWKNMRGSHIVS